MKAVARVLQNFEGFSSAGFHVNAFPPAKQAAGIQEPRAAPGSASPVTRLLWFVPAAGPSWARAARSRSPARSSVSRASGSHGHQLLRSPGWRGCGREPGWAAGLCGKGFVCVPCAGTVSLASPALQAGWDMQGLLTESGGALLTAVERSGRGADRARSRRGRRCRQPRGRAEEGGGTRGKVVPGAQKSPFESQLRLVPAGWPWAQLALPSLSPLSPPRDGHRRGPCLLRAPGEPAGERQQRWSWLWPQGRPAWGPGTGLEAGPSPSSSSAAHVTSLGPLPAQTPAARADRPVSQARRDGEPDSTCPV